MDDRSALANKRGHLIAAQLSAIVGSLLDQPLAPGLYLVATPIGNLGDISPRMLTTLVLADQVYCEDSRVSGPMLKRFGIHRRLLTYHEHSPETARQDILARIAGASSVAMISDAGMPAISDPGFKLVRDVIAAGCDVYSVPGPTALAAALTVSGLATDSFHFAGFLPQKETARRQRIAAIAKLPATLIVYESPHRLAAALTDLADLLGPRPAAVARELTKKFEEVRRATLPELAAWAATQTVRGEIAIVIAGAGVGAADEIDEATILAAARQALTRLPPAAAAKSVANLLGVSRAQVYDLILFLKAEQPRDPD